METCVGCGSPLAPSWKYCVHCGLAIERPEIAGAIRTEDSGVTRSAASSRALLFGGIGVFIVGIALLVIAIASFAGAFR